MEDLIGWLRDLAKRTARENSRDMRVVYPQLRIVNNVVRELLARKAEI